MAEGPKDPRLDDFGARIGQRDKRGVYCGLATDELDGMGHSERCADEWWQRLPELAGQPIASPTSQRGDLQGRTSGPKLVLFSTTPTAHVDRKLDGRQQHVPIPQRRNDTDDDLKTGGRRWCHVPCGRVLCLMKMGELTTCGAFSNASDSILHSLSDPEHFSISFSVDDGLAFTFFYTSGLLGWYCDSW